MTNRVINSKIGNIEYKGDKDMSKQATFAEKDSELIKKIETYQRTQQLPSFIEAVRSLCKKGLQINELINQKR